MTVEAGGLTVAEAVRQMRKALGMTQVAFGKAFDLSTRQVWELEAGVANPTAATLERLGKPFGFAPGFVLKSRKGSSLRGTGPLYIEARPKGRPEGSPINAYGVETADGELVFSARTQQEAVDWAKRNGGPAHVSRVRHLNDKRVPDHWRAV